MSGATVEIATTPSPTERLRRLLSYTEVQCIRAVLDVLPVDEGIVISSNLCDATGVTRSVMVNALRMCEAAGVIESRSLGMKGTHIKFLDRGAVEQAVAS